MVHSHSATSLIWRYCSALDITRRLSTAASYGLHSVPLCRVLAWERGGLPIIDEASSQLPVVRVTIDSGGIRKVERMSEKPRYKAWRTDSLAFAILEHGSLQGITAHFKFGFLCLELPETSKGLQTWDTPTLLIWSCATLPSRNHQLHAVPHNPIMQIYWTHILLLFGQSYAVHAHTKSTMRYGNILSPFPSTPAFCGLGVYSYARERVHCCVWNTNGTV